MSNFNLVKILSFGTQTLAGVAVLAVGTGCGQNVTHSSNQVVVKSTAALHISIGRSPSGQLQLNSENLTANLPISITNSPFTSMSLDTTQFVVPTITPSIMDFGQIAISTLIDNNLKVCGSNNSTRCTQALLRMYTIGEAGPGLYNRIDSYGLPLFSTLTNGTPTILPLGPTETAVIETFNIPSQKNVLRLSDFTTAPVFNIKSDFSNAGAGSYSTTLVIEYALAP